MRLHRPSYAAVVAHLALAVALSTGAAAAVVITGANVKNGSLTSADIKARSLTAGNIATGTLTGKQIKKHSVPTDRLSGPVPVDTTTVYDKAQSDARFLGINGTAANAANAANAATAANAALLGGLDASAFAKGKATSSSGSITTAFSPPPLTVIFELPGVVRVVVLNCSASTANFTLINLSSDNTNTPVWFEGPNVPAGSFTSNWNSIGSPGTASTWQRDLIQVGTEPTMKLAQLHVVSGISGTSCYFAATATVFG